VLRGGAQLRLADLAADKGGADAAAAAEAPKLLRKKAQGQHVVRHGLANGDAGRAAARCAPARRPGNFLAAAAPGAERARVAPQGAGGAAAGVRAHAAAHLQRG